MKRLLVAAVAVLALAGCAGISAEERNEVQTAVARELIPESLTASLMDGDDAAETFIEQAHDLAEELTTAILDDDRCGSTAYEAGIASSPEVSAAHAAGCARAAELGLL